MGVSRGCVRVGPLEACRAAALGVLLTLEPAAAGEPPRIIKPAVFDQSPARSRPVILIDPGHGGVDPGAIGRGKVTEKSVVLAVAKALKTHLDQAGAFDVRLTRSMDTFVPLQQRVQVSVDAKADLFISLHADTIDTPSMANAIHGASIYTLSDKASDEQARRMADKENAADLAAGIQTDHGEHSDELRGILSDLLARETASLSHLFSRSLVASLTKTGSLAREPERSASFVVLRQAQTPSVLVELGFLSNAAEEQLMIQPAWQNQMAATLASAINSYFARKQTAAAQGTLGLVTGGLPP
jgi:N-acetylmuramoyl-L-alanine amidase